MALHAMKVLKFIIGNALDLLDLLNFINGIREMLLNLLKYIDLASDTFSICLEVH